MPRPLFIRLLRALRVVPFAVPLMASECPQAVAGLDNGDPMMCTVSRITDGDTFVCADGRTIRLLLVDAPERAQRLGSQATARLSELLPPGSRVRFEFDVERQDDYGRDLAYVYTGAGLFVNRRLAEEGYVTWLHVAPNGRERETIVGAVAGARAMDRGLWAQGFADCQPRDFRAGRCHD